MKYDSPEMIAINLLNEAVESEGCHLTEADFENMVIKVNGSDEVVSACARAVSEILTD